MTGNSLAALRTDVLRTFGTVTRPPEFQIAPHECDECQQLSADLAGVDWTAMPDALIEENPSALSLLSPEAYAYFLPGYILYAIAHFSSKALASEMTVYSLAYNEPADEEMADWQRERLKFITSEQLDVLQQFLRLVEADAEFGDYVGREKVAAARERLRLFWAERWTA